MKRYFVSAILLSALLALTACGASAPQEDAGWVGMQPFVNEESKIRGLIPQAGWSEVAQVQLDSAPMDVNELTAELVKQTPDLDELPERAATYRGRGLTWDEYSLEGHLPGVDPLVRLNVALAEGDSLSYFVALAVLSEAYQAQPSLYDTVFRHVVYALEPLE
jgi:hypothetical protein